MDKSDVESQLSLIEAQLAFLREASLANDPAQLPPALAELQTLLLGLSDSLRTSTLPSTLIQKRLKNSWAMVSALREGLIRQSVSVERALAALVPTTQAITYGGAGSALRHQPYGTAARQSGEFRVAVA
jgi:hypothetical protein